MENGENQISYGKAVMLILATTVLLSILLDIISVGVNPLIILIASVILIAVFVKYFRQD